MWNAELFVLRTIMSYLIENYYSFILFLDFSCKSYMKSREMQN